MNEIIDALKGTPWWVYILLVYAFKQGYDATKVRVIRLYEVFILSVIFIIWSMWHLITIYHLSLFSIVDYSCSIFIGGVGGWLLGKRANIKIHKTKKLFRQPGTKSTLFIIVSIFFVKYFFGYINAVKPQLFDESFLFRTLEIGISGFLVGIFVGRALYCLHRFLKTKEDEFQ